MCNMVSRKTRSKTRKPKFLSLRLEISPETTQQSGQMKNSTPITTASHHHHHHHHHPQLNLFPLHPENLVEDKETTTFSHFFDAAADGGATATMTALLGAGSSSEKSDDAQLPPSLTYACRGQDSEEGDDLVRTALRSKERSDTCDEKWVSYEEVTSCAADRRQKMRTRGSLSLKLDYQEIMNAWTDKGPLYVQLESPQTVPDLLHDVFALDQYSYNGMKNDWGSNGGGLWTVPQISINNDNIGNMKVKTEEVILQGGEEEWKQVRVREASVLRYKEKRQNRLFAKRIRYEVRKINAEKRPRMKGRFVKRS
ncbi:hypothetical protein RHSIM_RhsimUnG0005000 [Rhododendron simsii]|uniref:CCT domain-containing protein n=1 Tax=Rhododendron simsii TaxID=118357 RepID=A0A834L5A6_RHOSS|nr:hypothetical protein RHSIM_RhsimUnG0005000 [Rhododendron simsii]